MHGQIVTMPPPLTLPPVGWGHPAVHRVPTWPRGSGGAVTCPPRPCHDLAGECVRGLGSNRAARRSLGGSVTGNDEGVHHPTLLRVW